MDELEIGVALIRKIDQRIQWLGKNNPSQQQIDFVIANRLEKESWRETIMREVAWELDLDGKRDMVVSNMAQLNLEFESVLPGQIDPSQITCAFYNVELYGKPAKAKVEQNKNFIWLTSNEICDGVTRTGVPISPLWMMLNDRAKVIQHWESDSVDL